MNRSLFEKGAVATMYTGLSDSLSGGGLGADAWVRYDVAVACTGEIAVHNINAASRGGLSLAPGTVSDDSNLACFRPKEPVALPGCGPGLPEQPITVELEDNSGAACGAAPQDSPDSGRELGSIWTDTTKQSSVSMASPGDTITYTVRFTNHSPIPLDKVRISDELPPGVALVPGSILPAPQPGETLGSGISLGPVDPGRSAALTYHVTVTPDAAGPLVNRARAVYFFQDCRNCPHSGLGSSRSCTVRIVPGRQDIAISKTADKTAVCMAHDEITYTLVVSNPGDTALTNVVVHDNIPEGLCYKAGSTQRNSGAFHDENPANGIFIGALSPAETYAITFILTACTASGCNQMPAEFVNTASVTGYAGGMELHADSLPWTVTRDRKCIRRRVKNCFSIPGFCCFRYWYLYQTDLKYHRPVNLLKVEYGIAVGYLDCDGKEKIMRYSGQLPFFPPSGFLPSRFRIRLTDLCCRSQSCGNITACFVAELCFCPEASNG